MPSGPASGTPSMSAIRSAQAQGKIDHASLTLMELADPNNRRAIIRKRPRIVRVGVEGISARMRRAVGKPMFTEELVACLTDLHENQIATHAFWIHGMPFETLGDWDEFVETYDRFSGAIDWGLHRAKLTQFQPSPPSPLTRYLPLQEQLNRDDLLRLRWHRGEQWRRVIFVAGGRSKVWQQRVADQYSVAPAALPWDREETVDMAPTFEDWERMPHEAIEWPIDAARRYRISDTFPRRLETPLRARKRRA